MKIATQKEPAFLYNLLHRTGESPDSEQGEDRQSPQTWDCPQMKHRFSQQSFRLWGPQRLQAKVEAEKRAEVERAEKRARARLWKKAMEAKQN